MGRDHIGDDGGIGDKGYVGTGLATPKKKPRGGELSTPGQGLQQRDQQSPLRGGTGNLPRQSLADLSHRLPETTAYVRSGRQNDSRSLLLQYHFLISLMVVLIIHIIVTLDGISPLGSHANLIKAYTPNP